MYGDENTKNIILEKSYKEYIEGFTDKVTGEATRGYLDIVVELQQRFSKPAEITKEKDKKEFVKLFGEYLRIENTLQYYDEFAQLKDFHKLDMNDIVAVAQFKAKHYLNDNTFLDTMSAIPIPSERNLQDYRSCYNDIREQVYHQQYAQQQENTTTDWSDIVFEVELLKSQEINLEYILELIFEKTSKFKDKEILNDEDKLLLIAEMRSVIRASVGNRAKESLINDFIMQSNFHDWKQGSHLFMEQFYQFARQEQHKEVDKLIQSEGLNVEAAKRFIHKSLKREYVNENGMELNEIIPNNMSPLNPLYFPKKKSVVEKIKAFVDKFKQIGEGY